jgi:hypothetical protein
VEAVRDATATTQETDSVEWKSAVTLSEKAWQGEIATHVIGFANREPGRARRAFGGHAYLILGAEPGGVVGIDLFDPADLENWIARYTGRSEGPRWEPHYTTVDGMHVLVLEIDAPQPGDPVYALRKTFADPTGATVPEGTVFVRRTGKTDRALAADIDMLNRRTAKTGSGLDLTLTWWEGPPVLRPVELTETAHESWLEDERQQLLAPLEEHSLMRSTSIGRALAMGIGETRTDEEYRDQVERHVARGRGTLVAEVQARAVAAGVGEAHFAIRNNTEHNFEQVAVELHIPGNVAAFFAAEDAKATSEFPRRPILFGTQRSLVPHLGFDAVVTPPFRVPPGSIDNAASARISFLPIHVRPDHTHALAPVHLVVSADHAGESIVCQWHATSTSVSGTDAGELPIAIGPDMIAMADVMAGRVEG